MAMRSRALETNWNLGKISEMYWCSTPLVLLFSDSPPVGEQQDEGQGDRRLQKLPVLTQQSDGGKNRLCQDAKQGGHRGDHETMGRVAQLQP